MTDTWLDTLERLDQQAFLALNQHHHPWCDDLMWIITQKYTGIPLYILILGFLIYGFRYRSPFIILGLILTITLADQLASSILKPWVARLRPCNEPAINEQVHIVRGYCSSSYGFVSSHAANTFALWIYLLRVKMADSGRNATYLLWAVFCWAVLHSYSRIYLGVHFPGDILCGGILGAGVGLGVSQLLPYRWHIRYP